MARRIGTLVAKASRKPELKQWNRTIEGKNRFPQVVRLIIAMTEKAQD